VAYLIARRAPVDLTPPEPPAIVQVHHTHDQFDNPALPMDNWAIRDGAWSHPATWRHGVPGPADRIVIHGERQVIQDDPDAQVGMLYLMDSAVLRHDATRDTCLTFGTIFLDDASEWHIHGQSEDDPVPAEITCRLVRRDTPLPGPDVDPKQFHGGIMAAGNSRVILRGAPKTTDARELRLAVEPLAGHATLAFVTPPTGWRPGDTVVIPPTDPYYSDADSDDRGWDYLFEVCTIASVAGAVVTLTAPLERDHRGAHDPKGELPPILPHVMNVTRNVVIESENPDGTRGHIMLAERCNGRIYHVAFRHLGRTRGSTLDSTTFAEDGTTVTHYGTNQVGRYPLHRHHCFGPVNLADEGYQGETVGCAFVGGRKWPITIHGTSYNLVLANNVHGGEHSLIACEDGDEAYNGFVGNLTFGPWAPAGQEADWPVSNHYWFLSPARNVVSDNVMAGGRGSAYLPHGIHTDRLHRGGPDGNVTVIDGLAYQPIPLHRGGDTMHGVLGVDYEWVRPGFTAYAELARNECYAMTKGPSFDHYHLGGDTIEAPGLVIADTTCWNCSVEPLFIYGGDQDVTIDGLVSWGSRQYGFTLNTQDATVILRNADIRCGAGTEGISHQGGTGVGQRFEVEDSYIFAPAGFVPYFPASAGVGTELASYLRGDVLRNVAIENPADQAVPALIRMSTHFAGTDTRVPACAVRVEVYDHQRVPGANFRLFYAEQAPDAILPAESEIADDPDSGFTRYAGLVPGQTNAESLAASGRCFGGELVPEGAEGPDPEGFPGAYKAPITD
jgi:hypothetical protein